MVRIRFPPAKSRANSGTDLEGRRVTPMRPMADSRRGAAAGQLRREPWRTKCRDGSDHQGRNRRHLPPAELGIAGFKLRLQDIDERDILRLNGDTLAKVASFALPGHPASIPSGRFLFLSVRC